MHTESRWMKPNNICIDEKTISFNRDLDEFLKKSKKIGRRFLFIEIVMLICGAAIASFLVESQEMKQMMTLSKTLFLSNLVIIISGVFVLYELCRRQMKKIEILCPLCSSRIRWARLLDKRIVCQNCKAILKDRSRGWLR